MVLSHITNYLQFNNTLEKDIDSIGWLCFERKEKTLYNKFNMYYKDDLLILLHLLIEREEGEDAFINTTTNHKKDIIEKLTFYYLS